jgi:hypothetical protein
MLARSAGPSAVSGGFIGLFGGGKGVCILNEGTNESMDDFGPPVISTAAPARNIKAMICCHRKPGPYQLKGQLCVHPRVR